MANTLQKYAQGWKVWYGRSGGELSSNMLQLSGGYITTYDGSPSLGDVRISFTGSSANQVTVAAKQTSITLSTGNVQLGAWPPKSFGWFGKHTKPVEKLYKGQLSLNEFVTQWTSEVSATLWLIRILGLVIMVIAFEMIVQPLSVAADLLRTINCFTCGLGSLLDEAAQCVLHTVAFILAVVLTFITVAIAWIVARPLYAILMVLASLAVLFGSGCMHKKSARGVAVNGGNTGLMAPAPQVAMAESRQPVTMQVTCPSNVGPGGLVSVMSPSGQQFQVQVPAGIEPGQVFNVQSPA
jgi:hypothetical protein